MTAPFVFGNVFNYATNLDVFGNVFQYGATVIVIPRPVTLEGPEMTVYSIAGISNEIRSLEGVSAEYRTLVGSE